MSDARADAALSCFDTRWMLEAGLSVYSAVRQLKVQLQRAFPYSVRSAALPSRSTDVRAPCASRAVSGCASRAVSLDCIQLTELPQDEGARTRKYRSLRVRNSKNVASPCVTTKRKLVKLTRGTARASPCNHAHLLDALFEDAVDGVLVLVQQRRDVVHMQNRGALTHARQTTCEEAATAMKAARAACAPEFAAPAAR